MITQLRKALNSATRDQDKLRISTIRLMIAAINDKEILKRETGIEELSEREVIDILFKLIKQRETTAALYREAGHIEREQRELEEMKVIREFLPKMMSEDEVIEVCQRTIEDLGAESIRDMGHVMSHIKQNYAGKLNIATASNKVKTYLTRE